MNIFNNTTIINRDRFRYLRKKLNFNTKIINKLLEERYDLYQSLAMPQQPLIVESLYSQIDNIDALVSDTQKSIKHINKQLLNNSNTINRTSIMPNSVDTRDYIHKTHGYSDLNPTTFAPSYPVRFKT